MNEEVKMYMDEAKEQMQNALVHLENELAKIRAGKANPKILNDVLVDYYGSPTPLSQVANITAPDPRTIALGKKYAWPYPKSHYECQSGI